MMDLLFKVNWYPLFALSVSVTELFLRATLVYLALFAILRFLPNRQVGGLGITDLLVVVMFANAAQNAMSSNYTSISDGFILVGTIIFWSYTLNWLGYRFARIQRLLSPPPVMLVKNGILIDRNMRLERLTEGELLSQLRQQGVEKLADVKKAFMEADGSISVFPHKEPDSANEPQTG